MIQEKDIPQMIVASSQHFVSKVSDELIEQFTSSYEKHLAEAGVKKVEPEKFFTVFHVNEYQDENYTMELWTQVEEALADNDQIQYKTLPESQVAYIIVSEHYDNLKFAYDALFHYVKEQGYSISGYPRETYLFDEDAPCGYNTEIQLPFTQKAIS